MDIAGFEWDWANREKCQSHGVSIAEIEALFTLPHLISPDVKHSFEEERFLVIGRTHNERPLFVVFTTRQLEGRLLARPISARYMHAKEFELYGR
ncbi:hypothetical protein SAMN05428969_0153 [Devosia sp. YR412]|uniref:BrnT family toxin n=1 Tax=Devosia sp. YR412 TaxID=1881030 RepID=UPI0008CF4CB1|nr:BrnT family toxin [Devosia sp. YR412]SEP61824.1 hypothetical protein SAMN05428969_0153 [Devosia sp. YR412]